jgi:hypothetical protein
VSSDTNQFVIQRTIREAGSEMSYKTLLDFIENRMRMSHVYQPVMLIALLRNRGKAHEQETLFLEKAIIFKPLSDRSLTIRDSLLHESP